MDDFRWLQILAVCLLDAAAGDPRWMPHPVRAIGWCIHGYERLVLREGGSPLSKKMAGTVLAVGLPLGCFLLIQEGLAWITGMHPWLGVLAWVIVGYTTVAGRDLWDHAMVVYSALNHGTLEEARVAVGRLVGRNTDHLMEPDIVRATVESVAENTSDGVIAPLCYLALGGPPLAMAYKAVNTLDSMIGHRNKRYRDFGWASARLDDVLNWVPSRLTALAISLSAAFSGREGRAAWNICRRDAGNHPSPNSGWPEAAMAGALGVELGGVNVYGGAVDVRGPFGRPGKVLRPAHIRSALHLMVLGSGLSVLVLVIGTFL